MMTDVRSLLRNERASRRVVHPQATYSTTGTLVCLVCHIQLKAESLWEKHLMSAQHAMRLQRIRDGTLGRPPGAPKPVEAPLNGGGKKRKADDGDERAKKRKVQAQDKDRDESFDDDTHGTVLGDHSQDKEGEAEIVASMPRPSAEVSTEAPPTPSNHPRDNTIPSPPARNSPQHIDEDEWAAFERDIATPPPATTVLTSEATISAAPLSAAKIAAQAREQASLQNKEKIEAVIEGEKEDAARRLEEEFEEMAGLEERVRRLREKREALRKENTRADEDEAMSEKGNDADDDHDDFGSDGEDDDWNDWGR